MFASQQYCSSIKFFVFSTICSGRITNRVAAPIAAIIEVKVTSKFHIVWRTTIDRHLINEHLHYKLINSNTFQMIFLDPYGIHYYSIIKPFCAVKILILVRLLQNI